MAKIIAKALLLVVSMLGLLASGHMAHAEVRGAAMVIDGKRGVGFTKGTAAIALEEQPGPVTVMTYTSDVQIGGKIAAVGQRLLESVGKMMTKQALEALNKELKIRLGSG